MGIPGFGGLYDSLYGFAPSTNPMTASVPLGSVRPMSSAATAPASTPSVAEAAAGIKRNTEGRATELAKDPQLGAAESFFGKVMGGQVGPYTDRSKAAMLSQTAGATASAQAAQMQALRDATAASGGSIYDPSFQAKSAELNAMRQGQNINALGDINSRAAEANFGAQMSGANQLASTRMGQNAQINAMRSLAAEHQGKVQAMVPSGTQPMSTTGGITTVRRF